MTGGETTGGRAAPVAGVESFVLTLPRSQPYLGPLGAGEQVNAKGYFVRARNRTVYPVVDRSVLVRIIDGGGVEGWGETYGLAAPGAAVAIIDDLLADFVVGRNPFDAEAIHDDLYDLMRVRGYTGGFYLDALAAIDIALWDLAGRQSGRPLAQLLGEQRRTAIPAYVSGLPAATLAERVAMAVAWRGRGFDAVKFADAVADSGPVAELAALRRALGAGIFLAASLHASATVAGLELHEFQHSVLRAHRDLLTGMPDCVDGAYRLPAGPGLGVRPSARLRRMIGLPA